MTQTSLIDVTVQEAREAAGGVAAVNSPQSGKQDENLTNIVLDGQWQFHLAQNVDEAEGFARFYEVEFDAAAFTTIPVPSNWEMQGFEDPKFINGTEPEGFYLHTFTVPEAVAGRRTLLHFGGVWHSAEVWLNGTRLGQHDSGFTAFAFDATAALKPGEENRLAVRVRQQTQYMKLDCNDDWALAGIYRNVWLQFTPKTLWIERVEVQTLFDQVYSDADLILRVFIARDEKGHYLASSPPFEVRVTLARNGETMQQETFTGTIAGSHNGRDMRLTLPVRAPTQWTAESPNLYDLQVELVNDGATVHTWHDRIGFRETTTSGGVLRINGQAVKLRGVCRHDLDPYTGRATRPERWRADIELMKAANINAVRTAHYPHAEGFIRLCDEMGLYVLEEIPFGFGGYRFADPSFTGNALMRVYETVDRDRNRPSVIIWDVGNESPFTPIQLAAARTVKGLDPTRPTLLPLRAEEDLPPEIDLLAPHYRSADEYDKIAASATRPVITTEYTHALGPNDFGGLQYRWESLIRHPAGAGGMIWMWADQGLRREINGRPVLHPLDDASKVTRDGKELVLHSHIGPNEIFDSHGLYGTDGIVDPDLKPQRDYWETKAVYAPVRALVDHLPFEAGQESVSIPIRNDYDFTDLSGVSIAWKLYRDDEVIASGEEKLEAPPHTETALRIPTTAIADAKNGGVSYLHLVFTNATGHEMLRQSVRLTQIADFGSRVAEQEALNSQLHNVQAARQESVLVATAGESRYEFNNATGELAALDVSGQRVIEGIDIVVWRAATWGERAVIDRRKNVYPWSTYLQNLPGVARSWTCEESSDGVIINATTEYRADEKNVIVVEYSYLVTPTGTLKIDYVVKPTVDIEWLPEIGIALKMPDQPQSISWLGLGPISSLPNKAAAALFGQWTAAIGSEESRDTKSGVEWVHLAMGGGRELRITGCVGFRWEDQAEAQHFRIFSHLAGAWSKGGKPERPEWRLELTEGRTFKGSFEFTPVISLP